MTHSKTATSADEIDLEDEAAKLFLRRREGSWTPADQSALELRLEKEANFADVFHRVEQSWDSVGRYATSPEVMALREQAIARARRASSRRWALPGAASWRSRKYAFAAAILLIAGVVGWQLSPYGYEPGIYRTGIGEQRTVELPDRSQIVLDARTRMKVRFSADARVVELLDGQAQFSVAKDAARPFKVMAGAQIIVAVGTVFNVEYIDSQVQVAMLEGRVAVLSGNPETSRAQIDPKPSVVELSAGETLQVRADGTAAIAPKADIEAANAWRQGKVIFHDEALSEAVHRLNRYSRQQVVVDDPDLARMKVSGVFDSGDAQAFAEAMQAYLSVTADFSNASVIHLRLK
jgi:transmembrane sensor